MSDDVFAFVIGAGLAAIVSAAVVGNCGFGWAVENGRWLTVDQRQGTGIWAFQQNGVTRCRVVSFDTKGEWLADVNTVCPK